MLAVELQAVDLQNRRNVQSLVTVVACLNLMVPVSLRGRVALEFVVLQESVRQE